MLELSKIKKTLLFSQLQELEALYVQIELDEKIWMTHSPTHCPPDCGQCCVNFEPDLLEVEADYLALWLIQHDQERAKSIALQNYTYPHSSENTRSCILFAPDNNQHCTAYEGRALICRLFGYSSDTGKDEKIRWKPCKFIPDDQISKGFTHKQYTEEELNHRLHAVPPIMAHYLRQALAIQPNNAGYTYPMREILPKAIQKIFFILNFIERDNPDDTPTSPCAA